MPKYNCASCNYDTDRLSNFNKHKLAKCHIEKVNKEAQIKIMVSPKVSLGSAQGKSKVSQKIVNNEKNMIVKFVINHIYTNKVYTNIKNHVKTMAMWVIELLI